ncbi:hypothetical protein AVEN_272363-1 [Araneus ventricosus]|uniref:Uncharacterized protein n=1 Tax=Araneus ventricosus TaxID=182803 RepID=A0A4Y2GT36_ARAVE|nr:hypothetical protein AVEN_272363-1 [Araneus ventricosus]
MAGGTLAQSSVIRFRSSCNVGGGVAYTRCLMYPHRKKSNGFRLKRYADADYKLGDTGIFIPKDMILSIPVVAMDRDSNFG